MALLLITLTFLFGALPVHAQSCTTVQPVFEPPFAATSTIFASTVTTISSVDCNGCSLEVSTFRAVVTGSTKPVTTATITNPVTTSASFVCQSETLATTPTGFLNSTSASSTLTPTAVPLPPVSTTVQTFIDELSTALLYTELISNGGNLPKLCSVINPSSLDEIKGIDINGSAVQNEVCAAAALDTYNASLAQTIISGNQIGVSSLATALFAIQVAGNYAGGANLTTLCSEIEADLIDALFINYILNVGTEVKNYVCSAASASTTSSINPTPSPAPNIPS